MYILYILQWIGNEMKEACLGNKIKILTRYYANDTTVSSAARIHVFNYLS